jgi:urea transport system substrate-binding protein
VRVGILHSQTGVMASAERPLIDAALFAIEEINARGGAAGRRIEAVVADGRSDPAHSAAEAERLITVEGVKAIFGCWTSPCRKAVKAVVEKHDHLLVYPLQYEGLEASPNILYTGLVPNQQMIPAVAWAAPRIGRRVYLLGSDYGFPRLANRILCEYAGALGIEVVGERYIPLEAADVAPALEEIARLKPDLVVNSVNGEANFAFFSALERSRQQVGAASPRVLSLSLSESEVAARPAGMPGHFLAWSYFQAIDTPENARFLAAFRKRFGPDRAVSDPMESTWAGLNLWARAADEAGDVDAAAVNRLLPLQSLAAPHGALAVDRRTRHVSRAVRVGEIAAEGRVRVVWTSEVPLRPAPYPLLYPVSEWRRIADAAVGGEAK